MNTDAEIWAVIARTLEGSNEPDDQAVVEKWRSLDPANERAYQEAKFLWNRSEAEAREDLKSFRFSADDWQKVANRIQIAEKKRPAKGKLTHHRHPVKRMQRVTTLVCKSAATILIAATSAYLAFQYSFAEKTAEMEFTYHEIRTAPGEKASIRLMDGSEASINADSGLSVPNLFHEKRREVMLDGHAFFEVSPDSARPFLIHTRDAIIQVLGTSIGVRSYSDEEHTAVAVRNGAAQVRQIAKPENSVVIPAGYIGRISPENESIFVEWAEEPEDYFGWLEGRLIFKQRSLSYVFRQLERWYNIKIEDSELYPEILKKEFTADLKPSRLTEVMDLIRFTMGVEYTMEGDQVFLTLAEAY